MSTPDTNLSSADAPAAVTPPVSAAARQSMLKTMITLVRRELCEHRALWITPLIVGGLLVLTAFPIHIGKVVFGAHEDYFARGSNRLSMFTLMLWGQTLPQYLVMVIVVSFYLMDCLYQERKDRSILFWKSLPVSDASTVISKLLVAVVVVPLGVYLTAMVSGVLFQTIWAVRAASGSLPNIAVGWDTVAWLKVQGLMLYGLLVSILWFAPMAAFLLLVSAWARRNVFLWAALPPLIAIIVERAAFGTRYIQHLLEYRSWSGLWNVLLLEPITPDSAGPGRLVSLADLFDNVAMSRAFLNIDLWLGLAVAAALVFAATRIRRYRDDT
jgi:ABC-2 type transport system permease protein